MRKSATQKRKKDQNSTKSKKQTVTYSSAMLEKEFQVLLTYLAKAPSIVQNTFAPYIKILLKELSSSPSAELIAQLDPHLPSAVVDRNTHIRLFANFKSLIDLPFVFEQMQSLQQEILNAKVEETKVPIVPTINLVQPKYYLTERLAKSEGELDVGLRTQGLPDNDSVFYCEPRFITRLNQMVHYKSNSRLKGNILMLTCKGHGLLGRRSYSILIGSSVQIWQMSSQVFPFPFAAYQDSQSEPSSDFIPSQPYNSPKFTLQYKFTAHSSKVTCACFSQDQLYLLTGSTDRRIRLWCLRLRTLLGEYNSHVRTVWDVQFNPSGYFFLSGGADGVMALWKTDCQTPQRLFYHGGDVYKVSFAKFPDYAISAGEDRNVKIWMIKDGTLQHTINLKLPIFNFNLGYSGIYLATVEVDGKVTIFNLLQGLLVASFYFFCKIDDREGKIKINDLCFSEDQREVCCLSARHIVLYSMDVIQAKPKLNIYENAANQPVYERVVQPKQILLLPAHLNIGFGAYVDYRLLVIGVKEVSQ